MTGTLQVLVSGISLGCLFALIALGFVVVAKATGVLNLAQGAFVLVGAYLCYAFHQQLELPFWLAALLAVAGTAALAAAVESFVVHRVASQKVYAPILVTFGVLIITPPLVAGVWGDSQLDLGDPWALQSLRLGDLSITHRDVAVIVTTAVVLGAFAAFFGRSRFGLAMQATASDPEAALAQGVSDRGVHRVSWAIAGALGALAGILLATTAGGGVRPGLETFALLGLPVIILGGIRSPLGAVVAGLLIGVVQQIAVVRVPDALGAGFYQVLPYLLMILIMLVRPEGLFGARSVRRV